jgi:hypothetical protein
MESRIQVRTFSFPGQEQLYNRLINSDNIKVLKEELVPCPKEGIVLQYLKYEQMEGDSKKKFPTTEVRVFLLPGQEAAYNGIANNDLIKILDERTVACPKEATILLYVKYEDYREEV